MRIRVVHRVAYRFASPIVGGRLMVMLKPRQLSGQQLLHHQLIGEPRMVVGHLDTDGHGNSRQQVQFRDAAEQFAITAVSHVDLPSLERPQHDDAEREATAWLERCDVTSLRGTCRERTTALLARLRNHGCQARYVAGYGAECSSRSHPHAWLALKPSTSWVDYDPLTHTLAPRHVTVAWGDGYDQVAPLSGSLGGNTGVHFRQHSSVIVEPIAADESPPLSPPRSPTPCHA